MRFKILFFIFILTSYIIYHKSFGRVSAQIPPPYIRCSDVRSPEFHTLRPYQASPCEFGGTPPVLTDPLSRPLEPARLYCVNDYLGLESFQVTPAGGANTTVYCVDSATTLTCYYERPSTYQTSVNLADAELPIMGNTQLVPNQVNNGNPQPENLAYNRRTAEYVSWYLNGPMFRMEETDYFYSVGSSLTGGSYDPDECARLISTYSGPLNKLLPIQVLLRDKIAAADRTGNSRHNKKVECELVSGPFRGPVPCGVPGSVERRTTDIYLPMVSALSYLNGDFWIDRPFISSFPLVPLSSTEDRTSSVETYRGIDLQNAATGPIPVQPPQPPSDADNIQIYGPTMEFVDNTFTDRDIDWLYLSHLEESRDLLDILSQTYLPLQLSVNYTEVRDELYYNTNRCDLTNVRWNTGDDVFGEISPQPDISGDFSYTSTFECTFEKPCFALGGTQYCGEAECFSACDSTCITQRTNCENTCGGDVTCIAGCATEYTDCRNECSAICTIPPCDVLIATAPFSVYTRTPLLDEIWGRSVESRQSVFRRIYPRIIPVPDDIGTLAFEILDLPGVTTANYSSTDLDIQVFAGNFTRSGARADIFYPHLGGIYEYFLIGIREALLPYSSSARVRQLASRPPPAVLPIACNWNPVTSSCDYFVPGGRCQEILTNDSGSNPRGDCPIDTIASYGGPQPVNSSTLCTDPVCESRRCNPYEWGPAKDYTDHVPPCSVPTADCSTGCKWLNRQTWDPDTYDDPDFNGCYYANPNVCVRRDASETGAQCSAVCNSVCCG